MAKYADYATDDLEIEIKEAAEGSEQRQGELPAQFVGKSAEEIARSYEELRKLQERQANELGIQRKTVSELTEQLVRSSEQMANPQPAATPITIDDLLEDPDAIIDQRVDQKVSRYKEELDKLKSELAAKDALSALETAHPGFREIAKTPEMRNWIADSGYRQRLAIAADQGDLLAAADLFDMYKDSSPAERRPQPNKPDVSVATLESGRTDTYQPTTKYSRSKLQLARIRKSQGDRQAEQWLAENADDIYRAYAEGRIVD